MSHSKEGDLRVKGNPFCLVYPITVYPNTRLLSRCAFYLFPTTGFLSSEGFECKWEVDVNFVTSDFSSPVFHLVDPKLKIGEARASWVSQESSRRREQCDVIG